MAKDKDRIINLNITMRPENCVLPDGKAVTPAEVCKNWILRMVRNAINKPDPNTNRPTGRADMQTQRQYAKLAAALSEIGQDGTVRLDGELWGFANRYAQRSTEILDDNLAALLVQVADRLQGAKEVAEEGEAKE